LLLTFATAVIFFDWYPWNVLLLALVAIYRSEQVRGDGWKPMLASAQPGCCSMAPLCPQAVHLAHCRSLSLDVSGPQRMGQSRLVRTEENDRSAAARPDFHLKKSDLAASGFRERE
jgi:hypothetical protein